MKCQCRAAELKQALIHTTGVTTRRASLSILAHVRIEVSNDQLTVQATDLSVAIEARVPATQTTQGVCAIDGQLLAKVLESASPRAVATLSHSEGTLTVTLPHGVTNIRTVAHEEFPPLPTIETPGWSMQLGVNELVGGLKSVLYAASPSEVKPEISAVYVHKKEVFMCKSSNETAKNSFAGDHVFNT